MALIRPSELPEDVRSEPFRKSEILFFDAAKNLPNDWHVLYGVTWFVKVRNNSWSEGEADFVIISPDTGIIIVEVKGGRIGRNENGWYSVDRNGEVHQIKDPTLQAANCKHKLLSCIRNHPKFADRFLPAKHMVCFPNISRADAPQIIEAPLEMQILYEDLDCLERKLLEFGKKTYDAATPKLSPNECRQIADILKPNFDCPDRWSIQAHRQNCIINSLTEEQNSIWEMIADNDRVAITGPAGSGKTILAIKSIKTCIQGNGRVLVLVPSKSLQEYYAASVNSDLLDTESYHVDSLSRSSASPDYDLIVIDEAQDITEDEWVNIYTYFNVENIRKLVCVFDSNQRLSKGRECPLEKLVTLKLTKVIRNTKEIAEFSSHFYKSETKPLLVGPNGEKIQYSAVSTPDDLEKTVLKIIRHYVLVEGFEYSDIVVLFGEGGKSAFKKAINNKQNSLGISFRSLRGTYDSYTHKTGIIIADSVYSYRGLENKIVILTGIEDVLETERLNICYVGASRARNVLHIVATSETIETMQGLF